MDLWHKHVCKAIHAADKDVFRLLDIMQALSAMDSQDLIPVDISIDLFDLISQYNS